jgi:hypothetical protein
MMAAARLADRMNDWNDMKRNDPPQASQRIGFANPFLTGFNQREKRFTFSQSACRWSGVEEWTSAKA